MPSMTSGGKASLAVGETCHSAAPLSSVSMHFNRNGERASVNRQSRRRLGFTSDLSRALGLPTERVIILAVTGGNVLP